MPIYSANGLGEQGMSCGAYKLLGDVVVILIVVVVAIVGVVIVVAIIGVVVVVCGVSSVFKLLFVIIASLGKRPEKAFCYTGFIDQELAEYINTPGWNHPAFYKNDDDDDVDYTIAITPILSIEEPENSLSMGDEHLDTIPKTESDEVIKSSIKDLVPIPSESEGIPDTMCDVHLVNNPIPFEAKDHFKIVINSNDDISSSDDDSLYNENIEYVEASPHDSELFSLEVAEIVSLEDKEIEDDNLHEKLSDFTHEEFADELAHIISPPEYDCFYFRNLPDPGEYISILNFGIRENLSSTTLVNLPVEDDHSPLLPYVVWIGGFLK
nr:hypothetical protein [Tanacetum cinerariifolium]